MHPPTGAFARLFRAANDPDPQALVIDRLQTTAGNVGDRGERKNVFSDLVDRAGRAVTVNTANLLLLSMAIASLAWSIGLCWYVFWRTERDDKLAMDQVNAIFSARLAELGRKRRAAEAKPGEWPAPFTPP